MGAVVEVVCGAAVRKRMQEVMPLEPFPLWGRDKSVPLFLEWEDTEKAAADIDGHNLTVAMGKEKRLRRFVLFAYHSQSF